MSLKQNDKDMTEEEGLSVQMEEWDLSVIKKRSPSFDILVLKFIHILNLIFAQ